MQTKKQGTRSYNSWVSWDRKPREDRALQKQYWSKHQPYSALLLAFQSAVIVTGGIQPKRSVVWTKQRVKSVVKQEEWKYGEGCGLVVQGRPFGGEIDGLYFIPNRYKYTQIQMCLELSYICLVLQVSRYSNYTHTN